MLTVLLTVSRPTLRRRAPASRITSGYARQTRDEAQPQASLWYARTLSPLECPLHGRGIRLVAFLTEPGTIRNFVKDRAIAPISGGVEIRELKLWILAPTPALDREAWLP